MTEKEKQLIIDTIQEVLGEERSVVDLVGREEIKQIALRVVDRIVTAKIREGFWGK